MRTVHYSDYIRNISGLIGVDSADLQTTELTIINTFFNKNLRNIWQSANWTEVTRATEYRVPGNILYYPNTASRFTLTGVTATDNAYRNPVDSLVESSKVTDSVVSGTHAINKTLTEPFDANHYTFAVFIHRGSHRYFKLSVFDALGAESYSTFDLVSGSGSQETADGFQVESLGGGWFRVSVTAYVAAAGIGSVRISTSLDNASWTYSGTGKYYFLYGCSVSPVLDANAADLSIPIEYPGLDEFDAVFNVYRGYPWTRMLPAHVPYTFTQNGINIVSSTSDFYPSVNNVVSVNSTSSTQYPVYVHYRKAMPKFRGNTYSASTAYTEGDCVYYTDGENSDYYVCILNSTGNAPTNATYWKVSAIPEPFLDYTVYSSYADWLIAEGQQAKAAAMFATAQEIAQGELDRLERQNKDILPTKYQTHLTSRSV